MARISCFYNCGASGLTLANIEKHYQQYHAKLKPYWLEEFTCDKCLNSFSRTLLYSPARKPDQLNHNPHYCGKCANLPSPPSSLKPKLWKKLKKEKLKSKVSLRKSKKPFNLNLSPPEKA